jgi:hypothetical protein
MDTSCYLSGEMVGQIDLTDIKGLPDKLHPLPCAIYNVVYIYIYTPWSDPRASCAISDAAISVSMDLYLLELPQHSPTLLEQTPQSP